MQMMRCVVDGPLCRCAWISGEAALSLWLCSSRCMCKLPSGHVLLWMGGYVFPGMPRHIEVCGSVGQCLTMAA